MKTKFKMDKKKTIYLILAGVAVAMLIYIVNPSLTGFAVADGQLTVIQGSKSCAVDGKIKIQFVYSDLCSHCQEMKPNIEMLETKYEDLIDIEWIDGQDPVNAWLIKRYDIKAIPVLVFDCEKKLVGYHNFEQVEEIISSMI